jgi:hypothetical protein
MRFVFPLRPLESALVHNGRREFESGRQPAASPVSVRRFGGGVRWNSPNLFEIPPISKRCKYLGKHISGTVVLGYTVSALSFGDCQPGRLDLRLWLAEAAA